MNAKDFIAIWEYQKAFKKPSKPKRKKDVDLTKLNLAEVFLKLREQQEKIKGEIEQIEKLLKKEDKKKEEKKLNPLHVAMVLIGTTPITGPLLLLYWAKMFAAIQGVH